jgi:hypothetical protein
MSFKDSNGNNLTKTELLALATAQAQEPLYLFNANVYKAFHQDGTKAFEGAEELMFHTGQIVPQSTIDALFKTATVTSISPATGAAAGGTAIVISGTDLSGTEGVTFGGTAATNVVVVSNQRVTCTAPAHATGAVSVVVRDDAGDVTVTSGYTYS